VYARDLHMHNIASVISASFCRRSCLCCNY